MDVSIRAYDAARDAPGVRACFVHLQDEEREVFPDVAGGEELADEYLQWMHERVTRYQGAILVAIADAQVVGFVTVLGRVPREAPDDPDPVHATISELVVMPSQRGGGLGARLVGRAEAHARSCGTQVLRVARHGGNDRAHAFYAREGFEPIMVLLEKRVLP